MSTHLPPTIDPQAARRWSAQVPLDSPWLHEEVARRMEARLEWIVRTPQSWIHWGPMQGGRQIQSLLVKRYPKAQCFVHEATEAKERAAAQQYQQAWWKPERWLGVSPLIAAPPKPVQMLWANMALHMEADPQGLIARWHAALAVDGFLMFSCLGPDTLRELRPVYEAMGWGAPSHAFTDMHDWGDMLVHAGFGEPIMDMERVTLTYSSADKLLEDLKGLGRNLHQQRFSGLRGRNWQGRWNDAVEQQLRGPDGRLALTFEVIYGHAFKPAPKLTIASETTVSLEEMRRSLRQIKS